MAARDRSVFGAPRALRGRLVIGDSLGALRAAVERTRIGAAGHLLVTDPDGRTAFANALDARARVLASPADADAWFVRSCALPGGLRLHARVPARELAAARARIAGDIAALVAVAVTLTSGLLFPSMRRRVLDPIAALGAAARSIGERVLDEARRPLVWWPRSCGCARAACAWPWTTSAPATPRSPP